MSKLATRRSSGTSTGARLARRPIATARFAAWSQSRRLARRLGLRAVRGKVFGIGLTRTGTSSLAQALNTLDLRCAHYPDDERTIDEITTFLADGGRLTLSILDRFDAATDTPVCSTFEALDRSYPDSRFILTTREKRSWLGSCRAFWEGVLEPFLRNHPDDPNAVYMRAIHQRLYGGAGFDEERFSRAYDEYHERVKRHFRDRPEDLLTLDISGGEGWQRLCAFIGAPTPTVPFPWEHQRPGPSAAAST